MKEERVSTGMSLTKKSTTSSVMGKTHSFFYSISGGGALLLSMPFMFLRLINALLFRLNMIESLEQYDALPSLMITLIIRPSLTQV